MTAPLHPQFYAGDNNQFRIFRRYDDTQMLLFCRVSFNSIFRIRVAVWFAFTIINFPIVQHFVNFPWRNMAAVHPAPGMFRKNQLRMAVKRFICNSMIRTVGIRCARVATEK